jgi:hypothetical protein
MRQGSVAPTGTLVLRKRKRQVVPKGELSLYEILKYGFPNFGCSKEVALWRFKNIPNLWRGLWRLLMARFWGLPIHYGQLSLTVIRKDGSVLDLGLASFRLVTDTGVGFIVDAFQNTKEMENMKFHGFGTGGAAEAAGNTALTTELTTQYVVDNTRPTGTTAETATNIYQTVATLSPDSGGTIAITEHGVFDQAATGGGVMIDRTLFSAVNIVAGSDSLQADYRLTFTSGS